MVLFFTATLLISCFALVLLLSIKRWELTTGRVMGSSLRPHISGFFHTVSLWVEHILPTLVKMYTRGIWQGLQRTAHWITAHVVVRTEHTLERFLHTLRHTTDPRRGMNEKPSLFLREVSEHKRKLLHAQRMARQSMQTNRQE